MTWPLQLTAGSYKINLYIFVLFAVCGLAVTKKKHIFFKVCCVKCQLQSSSWYW